MAVKVVSEGPVRVKRVVCDRCGYKLEFTEEDVHRDIDSEGHAYSSIFCPRDECHSFYPGNKNRIFVGHL